MITATVSHYNILKKIGEGGMGEVYLAYDKKLKRQVAIKFLPSKLTINNTDKTRFLQEAQAAAAINHPHVCVIHDIKEYEDQQFIVMEYVEGQTLSDKIASGSIPMEQSIEYALQIGSALKAAHDKEIIHRDIKSDNIMVSTTNQIKVMDFGLAKIKGSVVSTTTMQMAGTIAYMSPEQIEGKKIDPKSDIFSFGVVLYEMLAGRRPFQEKYESALIYSILNEEPVPIGELNSDVPKTLARIVNKALEKERSKRYQHMDDISEELENISNQIGISSISRRRLQPGERPIQSIVVLPLVNYSKDPEQEYFVDGITEALITSLAKIHSLRVISRSSAMHYKTTCKSIPEIAQELNVDAVVEGTVTLEDKRVRITAQLIHATTDTHIWAENYDRDFKDILSLQSEVAQTIAREIKIKLSKNEKKQLTDIRSVNAESYDAYLKGRFHWYKLSPQNFQKALDYFSLALEKDPECALAYAGAAMVWFARVYWGISPPNETMPKAKTLVLRAMEMDDALEEAHDVLARILYFYEWDWEGAEREFRHAIQINPNKADVHLFYSAFLRSMGRGDQANSEAEIGLELDPLNSFSQCYYVGQLLYLRQYDEAILQLKKILDMESDFPFVYRYLWICYHQQHMYDEAIEEAINFFSSSGKREFAETLSSGYAKSDYKGAMRLLAKSMVELEKKFYIQPVWIARLFAYGDEKEPTLVWLEKAYEQRDLLMTNLNTSSDWEILHYEERFKKLVSRMNFPR